MIIKRDRENFYMLNWLDKYMIGHKGFICGGCFKNIFSNEKVKDLDIFFKSKQDWEDAVEHFDKLCGKNNDGEYTFYYENDNVKAYKDSETGITLELCCKIFGEAEDIIKQFDFTITKFAYYKEEIEDDNQESVDFWGDVFLKKIKSTHIEYKILCDDMFFEHLHLKRLVTDDQIKYPMSTFERMIRYIKYGYMPCKETKMKICKSIQELSNEQLELSDSLYEGMD